MRKVKFPEFILVAAWCGCLSGCSLLGGFFRDADEPVISHGRNNSSQSDSVPQSSNESDSKRNAGQVHEENAQAYLDEIADMQLKLTRLTARMTEIEEQQSRQKERMKIIERGLTLGIVPDELRPAGKAPGKVGTSENPPQMPPVAANLVPAPSDADDVADADVDPKSDADHKTKSAAPNDSDAGKREEFNKAFGEAHDDFRAGRFGKAIVSFSDIGKKFDSSLTNGVHEFWIARSWSGLREFQTARKLYTEFISSHPESPWLPRAKLELARVEMSLGLRETAIKRFRQIISEHPLEDVSEMAKADVARISKTL